MPFRSFPSCLPYLFVCCAWVGIGSSQAVAQSTDTFDYHTVRGRSPKPFVAGRFEGELLSYAGRARSQPMDSFGDGWSGQAQVLWDGAVGESMEATFELDEGGVFDLQARLTLAPDYGVFQMSVNGTTVKQWIDTYSPNVELGPLISLSQVHMQAGEQRLAFKLIGSNPKSRAIPGRRFLLGLDYLHLHRNPVAQPVGVADGSPRVEQPVTSVDAASGDASNSEATSSPAPTPLPLRSLAAAFATYCYECHVGEDAEGGLQLDRLDTNESLWANIEAVQRIRNALQRGEMPPQDERQPSARLRTQWVATLDAQIDEYLREHVAVIPNVMRRLNRFEYSNAVRDLLKLKGDIYPLPEKTIRADVPYFDPASGRFPRTVRVGNRTLGKNQVERQTLTGVSPFAIDLQAEGGFNNQGAQLSVSPLLLDSLLKLGRSIVHSPEFDGFCESKLFERPSESSDEAMQGAAKAALVELLESAFREPLDAAVLDRYHRYFLGQLQETGSYRDSMKNVVAAVLASPRFIYVAKSTVGATENGLLSSWELADRLAFFLWSTIPDAALLDRARDGSLVRAEVLDAEVQRMLLDPRSQALSQNFARQWLRLDQLIAAVPDFDRFESYYSRIGCEQWKFGLQTMIEPLLLFESVMVEDRSIMLLVDCNYTYRSNELQSWYVDQTPFAGRENRSRFDTNQQQYTRRSLTQRREGGVITNAATMTMTSAPLRTSPIVRGAWVATAIFNQPPPPPPDDIPQIEADDKAIEAKGITLRERLVQHQVNQSCKACHAKIDPLGFALENFDAVGRWRETYGSGLKIDASGKLFGKTEFSDVVGLKDAILEHPEWFMRAFVEHMLSYALGRELELADRPTVDSVLAKVVADRGQFTTVVRQIALSHPFRYRATGGQASREQPGLEQTQLEETVREETK